MSEHRKYNSDLTYGLNDGALIGWTPADTAVAVFTDPDHEHPASFDLSTHEITINTTMTDGDSDITIGFLAHEAGHVEWSTPWRLEAIKGAHKVRWAKPGIWDTIVMLDEIRIERRSFDKGGKSTGTFLRKSFLRIVKEMLDADKMPTSGLGLSHLWALTCGRELSAIADKSTVESVDFAVRLALGNDMVDSMREILGEFVVTDNFDSLVDLAEEWVALVGAGEGEGLSGGTCGCDKDGEKIEGAGGDSAGETAEEAEEGEEGKAPAKKPDGKDGESEAEDEPEGRVHGVGGGGDADSKPATSDDKIISGDSPEEPEPEPESTGPSLTPEEAEELLRPALDDLKEEVERSLNRDILLADPRKWSEKVFGPQRASTKIRYTEEDVDPVTQRKAIAFARALEDVVTPSIVRTKVTSTVPPGRMRGRVLVRQAAERSLGLNTSGDPWKATKRQHVMTRPVVVGIATDVSGSMYWAEQLVAQFTYVIGYAGTRISARTAAVTFGSYVTGTLKPGDVPSKKRVVPARDGTEEFDYAMAALDGVLNLRYQNRCTKLLFIFSDGHLVKYHEMDRAVRWVTEVQAGGTEVFWVAASAYEIRKLPGVHFIERDREKDGDARLFAAMGEAVRKLAGRAA